MVVVLQAVAASPGLCLVTAVEAVLRQPAEQHQPGPLPVLPPSQVSPSFEALSAAV